MNENTEYRGHKGYKGHKGTALTALRTALYCVLCPVLFIGALFTQESRPIAQTQNARNPPASLTELEAAVKRNPDDPKLYVALGLAYWDRNDYERARETFERAVQIAPQSAEAHNWLGVALAEKANLPAAIAEFRKAVALDPQYGRAHTNLGSALAKSGDFAEAVEVFQKALALEPNSLAAHMNLGMALREKGDLEAALEHLRRVADADGNNASLQYELGQTLRQSGDLPAAAAAFERALEIQPELREGYYALGMTLKEQSAAARKPRAAAPGPADDIYAKALEAAGRNELNAARERLAEVLQVDENHAEAHNLLGFILGQRGDLPSALTHLERATALRPDLAEAHYNLGIALWYSGSRPRAVSELRESIKLEPASGPSHAFLGNALRDTGDLAGARASLQRAIALLPPTAAVFVDLGIAYLRAGELERALGQFEAGLNLPSRSSPTPDWEGAIAGLREAIAAGANVGTPPGRDVPTTEDAEDRRKNPVASRLEEARGALSKVEKTGSNLRVLSVLRGESLAAAYNVLGRLLGGKGADSSEVAAAFREAIRLGPDFAEAHNNLGLVLIQAGNDQAGIAALREAVRINPQYAEARANLGAALTPTDTEEAVRELEQAVALAPTSVNAQFNLAVAYGASPRLGSAKEIDRLRKVIALDPTFARAHLALGKALLTDRKVAEAIDELREAVRLEPDHGEAHYQLGLALARAGRSEEATSALQKGRELVAAADRSQNARLDVADGRAALEKGDLEQAAARFRRAIQLRPDAPDAHRYLGTVLERQGNAEGAAVAYRKALELNPTDVSARERLDKLTNLGAIGVDDPRRVAELEGYIRQGRYKEVEPLLTSYVKDRTSSSWGWYALGYSLFAQQKIGESIQALAKSLELDVRNAEAHKILGRNLMIIGRFDAAQVEFEQGIRYQPDSAEIHYNLGKLLSIQDNWEPARKAFEAAVRIDQTYVEALDGLALALEALGDDAAAVAKYEQAIALNDTRQGKFTSAHVNLSAYYNRTGHPEKALEYARRALAIDAQSDRAWFQKGRADERQGRLDEAVESLNKAISINPRASSYFYVLAGLYRHLGNAEESRKALESFTRLERESSELEKMRREAVKRE
jgi:tetratricopeptide (TPR) repeat protein